jgi:hypothetical protein
VLVLPLYRQVALDGVGTVRLLHGRIYHLVKVALAAKRALAATGATTFLQTLGKQYQIAAVAMLVYHQTYPQRRLQLQSRLRQELRQHQVLHGKQPLLAMQMLLAARKGLMVIAVQTQQGLCLDVAQSAERLEAMMF